jgi:tRNA(Ile2) C34 agmatinyltransferase TiaS
MTPAILWALLAVTVAVVIGIGKFIAARMARAEALRALNVHRIDPICAVNGHAYRADGTGWRCATCGNHVSGREGELYGLAKEGRHERRRNSR